MRAGTAFVGWMLLAVLLGLSTLQVPVHGQAAPAGAKPAAPPARASATAPENTEWSTYGGDLRQHALHAARSDQQGQLQQARSGLALQDRRPRPASGVQLPVDAARWSDGVLYVDRRDRAAPSSRSMPRRGELLWMHREDEGKRGEAAPRQLSGRGLAYWTDGKEARIVYVTPGYQMIALDAKTGVTVPAFGKNGVVDLKLEDDQVVDLETGEIGLHAAPIIAKDVIVVGAAHLPGGAPKSRTHEKGYIRGYDARTGKRLWIFHTIPLPGEFGNDTWENDSCVVHRQRRRVGADDRRRRARHGLPAGGVADRRLLRRPSARQRPVRRKPRRARSQDRRAQVALPARAPRHLGLRHSVRADPRRHHRQRASRSRRSRSRPSRTGSTSSIA